MNFFAYLILEVKQLNDFLVYAILLDDLIPQFPLVIPPDHFLLIQATKE